MCTEGINLRRLIGVITPPATNLVFVEFISLSQSNVLPEQLCYCLFTTVPQESCVNQPHGNNSLSGSRLNLQVEARVSSPRS